MNHIDILSTPIEGTEGFSNPSGTRYSVTLSMSVMGDGPPTGEWLDAVMADVRGCIAHTMGIDGGTKPGVGPTVAERVARSMRLREDALIAGGVWDSWLSGAGRAGMKPQQYGRYRRHPEAGRHQPVTRQATLIRLADALYLPGPGALLLPPAELLAIPLPEVDGQGTIVKASLVYLG